MSFNKNNVLFFLIMMVVLPVLAESIYSPGLPYLALSFNVTTHAAENTLSIYLLGFALGTLFWGHLSDFIGRRPVLLSGFVLFIVATYLCYIANDFSLFMFARCLQAFGGAGSCLAQSINRDVFEQKERMGVSSSIGTCVSIAPAVGAVLGGYINLYWDWRITFLLLLVVAIFFTLYLVVFLPETKTGEYLTFSYVKIKGSFLKVFTDSNLILHALMIGLGLGVFYTFLGEGPFYFIRSLGMSSSGFGWVCAAGAIAYSIGCRVANNLINSGVDYRNVMLSGLVVKFLTYVLFLLFVGMGFVENNNLFVAGFGYYAVLFLVFLWVVASFALSLILTPSFALVLENQVGNAGVAASWFGFFNNGMNALINTGMAYIHADLLYIMPLYFLFITVMMFFVFYRLFGFVFLESRLNTLVSTER